MLLFPSRRGRPTTAERDELSRQLAGVVPCPDPPPTAPGYAYARTLGLLPPLPSDTPPRPLSGRCARERLALAAAGVVAGLVLATTVPPPFTLAGGLLMGASLLSVFLWCRPRIEAETMAGYTTLWSSTGQWRLDRHGRVAAAPDGAYDPPGWYPSPHRPGLMQFWTGREWRFEGPSEAARRKTFKEPAQRFL